METPWEVNALYDSLSTLPLLDDLRLEAQGDDFSLAPFSGLRRLSIRTSSVWTMLRTNPDLQIHLKDRQRPVTPNLLAYLASYAGVEKLRFFSTGNSQRETDDLAGIFFTTVLPRHAECFGTHNVDAVSSLHKLRNLKISINPDEAINAAELLVRTADLLHDLQLIEIDSAIPESSRNVRRGCVIATDDTPVDMGMKKALQDFRSRVACPTILRFGFRDRYVYVRTAVEVESTLAAEGGAT
ncbi:hypothetical protein C8R44DRAFT_887394 [Mycena epipterygia]|nr:hypothetical protein C8R44DRAFT_887394 [Mycena epipterygia]